MDHRRRPASRACGACGHRQLQRYNSCASGGALPPSTPGIIKLAATLKASDRLFYRRVLLCGENIKWDTASGAPVDDSTPGANAFGVIEQVDTVDWLASTCCTGLDFSSRSTSTRSLRGTS